MNEHRFKVNPRLEETESIQNGSQFSPVITTHAESQGLPENSVNPDII